MRLLSLIFALVIISYLVVNYSNTVVKPDASDQTVKQQTKQVIDEAKQATEQMQKALEQHQKRVEEMENN